STTLRICSMLRGSTGVKSMNSLPFVHENQTVGVSCSNRKCSLGGKQQEAGHEQLASLLLEVWTT
ncbi:MAG: hypothetical protein QF473_17845, partial [Planctomycetota bacterium]|nr:hypothetical protein [Planctomycetota bacterium]